MGILEKIMIYLMMSLQTKRKWMAKQQIIVCSKVQKKLDQLIEGVGSCIARLTGQNKLEIQHIY